MSKRKHVTATVAVVDAVENENVEYDSKSYWDNRYVNSNGHEWYYSFEILEPLFVKLLTESFDGHVLEIGCGDKPLVEGFATKFPNATSIGIDYSQNVIDLLNNNKGVNTESITYKQMDARRTNFVSDSFDFIVDKGTMDAMLSAQDVEQGFANVSKIFKEAVRVMNIDAKFMIVSHIEADSCEFHELMQNVILPALDTKRNVLWDIEAHVVSRSTLSAPNNTRMEQSKRRKSTESEEEEQGHGTVYIISSKRRKFTRNMLQSGAPVGFKVLQYDSDSDEEDDE